MPDPTSHKITRRAAISGGLGAGAGLAAMAAAQASAAAGGGGRRKGKKVLVAIGDFSEGLETYYMVYRLKEEGIVPVVAAVKKKTVKLVVHDFDPHFSNYTESRGYFIQSDVAYADVDPREFDALLIPGGRGPEEIRQYDDALRITRHFLDGGLPLGAMCHGPQVIWAAGSVKGRKMTCYYGIRPDLELAGATFVDRPAIADERMVTSRGWPDLPDFMPIFLDILGQ